MKPSEWISHYTNVEQLQQLVAILIRERVTEVRAGLNLRAGQRLQLEDEVEAIMGRAEPAAVVPANCNCGMNLASIGATHAATCSMRMAALSMDIASKVSDAPKAALRLTERAKKAEAQLQEALAESARRREGLHIARAESATRLEIATDVLKRERGLLKELQEERAKVASLEQLIEMSEALAVKVRLEGLDKLTTRDAELAAWSVVGEASRRVLATAENYFEEHGAEHEREDCPEDDTCECFSAELGKAFKILSDTLTVIGKRWPHPKVEPDAGGEATGGKL